MKLALIHNPSSGYNRRHPLRVPSVAAEAGIPCWTAGRADEFVPAMQAIAKTAPDVLIVNGGDGTVDAVVTCMRRTVRFATEPVLVILPGGSTNMIARDVGFARSPERALRRLARAAQAGKRDTLLQRVPLAVMSEAQAAGPLGFFFAAGALPALLQPSQEKARVRGAVGKGSAVLALARTVGRLFTGNLRSDAVIRPRWVSWSVDAPSGAAIERAELVLYFVTTLDRLVVGIRPGQPRPGLRLVGLRFPYRNIIVSVAGLVTGRAFHRLHPDFLFRSGQRLQLTFEGDAVLDGEALPLPAGTKTIELASEPPVTFWRL